MKDKVNICDTGRGYRCEKPGSVRVKLNKIQFTKNRIPI